MNTPQQPQITLLFPDEIGPYLELVLLDWNKVQNAASGKTSQTNFERNGRFGRIQLWQVQSKSSPKTGLYLLRNGEGFCTCWDFQHRGIETGRPCRHLRALNDQKHIVHKEVRKLTTNSDNVKCKEMRFYDAGK